MAVPYKVKFQNSAERGMYVELDKIAELAIPAHLAVAIGPMQAKINRLAEYYNKAFSSSDKKHERFRFVIASVHKNAVETGILTVVSASKAKEVHTKGFVKFINDNQEAIAMVTPYLLGDTSVKSEEGGVINTPNIPTGIAELDAIQLNGEGLERLSVDDMKQIKQLMLNQKNEEVEHVAEEDKVVEVQTTEVEPAEQKEDPEENKE